MRRKGDSAMPKPREPWWHDRDRCYYTRVDGKQVMLRHRPVDGRPGPKVAHGDAAGVRAAVERLLAERDARVKRAADPTVLDVCREYLIATSRENTVETTYGKEW